MNTSQIVSLLHAGTALERVLAKLEDGLLAHVVDHAITFRLARDAARELAASREAAEAMIASLAANLGEVNGNPVVRYPFASALLAELRNALR